jgi:tetratricopeptide (TPR) repeat protein
VVFLAVVLFFVVKPFKFQISGDQQAVAAERSLAIMYFENVADREDPRRFGEIVTNLLITDLSESEYLQVVSSQRLYDILKLQGKEGVKVIDRDTATAVARHAGAKWMLLGSILQEEPNLIMTSRLVDVESGKVVASQRITGEPEDQIFALVDRLTDEIKDDLALPAAKGPGSDVAIAEVTTHSMDAYRYYLEGMEYANQFYGPEAKAAFEKALEYDSTFAMVYLRQASGLVTPKGSERKRALAKAIEYSGGVSKKEKQYIDATAALFDGDVDEAIVLLQAIIEEHPNDKDAYMALGDIYRNRKMDRVKAIEYYRRVIEIDPMYKFAYNMLAYSYQAEGDIDNYIWAIQQYMMLAPDEANPYDSRADLYAFSGKVDKAIESYRQALERKPDFYPSVIKIGHMHLFKGEYATAASFYQQLVESGDEDNRSMGRLLHVLIPARQGKLNETLKVIRQGIAADEMDGYTGHVYFEKGQAMASVYAEMGELDRAIAECEKWNAAYREQHPDDTKFGTLFLIRLTARKGDFKKADELLAELKDGIEDNDKGGMVSYDFVRAVVQLERGEADSACVIFEKIAEDHEGFNIKYNLALAYLKAGRVIESANEFERLLRRYSENRATSPFEAVRAHYYLGIAHEESGRVEEAVEQYEEFLKVWKDADPVIEGVRDAKERLARLRQTG